MKMNILVVCSVVITLILILAEIFLRIWKERKLLSLYCQDKTAFDAECQKVTTRLALPPYSLEYLKLNRYLMDDDESKIEQQFEHLFHMKKTKEQSKDIFLKGFCYFLEGNQKDQCTKCLEELKKSQDRALIETTQMIYEVYGNHNHRFAKQLRQKLKDAPSEERYLYEHLLAVLDESPYS